MTRIKIAILVLFVSTRVDINRSQENLHIFNELHQQSFVSSRISHPRDETSPRHYARIFVQIFVLPKIYISNDVSLMKILRGARLR